MIKTILIITLVLLTLVTNAQVKKDTTFKHYPKSMAIHYGQATTGESLLTNSEMDSLKSLKSGTSKVISRKLKDGSIRTVNAINRDGKISFGGSISHTQSDSAIEFISGDGKTWILNKRDREHVKFLKPSCK